MRLIPNSLDESRGRLLEIGRRFLRPLKLNLGSPGPSIFREGHHRLTYLVHFCGLNLLNTIRRRVHETRFDAQRRSANAPFLLVIFLEKVGIINHLMMTVKQESWS